MSQKTDQVTETIEINCHKCWSSEHINEYISDCYEALTFNYAPDACSVPRL